MHLKTTRWMWTATLCAAILIVLFIVAMVCLFAPRPGHHTSVVQCDKDACTARVARAFPAFNADADADADAANGHVVRLRGDHRITPNAAVFNPSVALVPSASTVASQKPVWRSVSTSRLSNFSFCPGRHLSSMLAYPYGVVDHVIVVADDDARILRVPSQWWTPDVASAWFSANLASTSTTSLKALQESTLQDARPFALAPDVLGIVCTLNQPPLKARIALAVVRLPFAQSFTQLFDTGEDRVEPDALILFADEDAATPQKNWMPRVNADALYFVKHVHPQAVVSVPLAPLLRARGVVIVHPESVPLPLPGSSPSAVSAARALLSVAPRVWRGSSQLIPFGRIALLGMVHRRHGTLPWFAPLQDESGFDTGERLRFTHAFALFDATPPFVLRALSRPFRITARTPNGAAANFAFVSGLCDVRNSNSNAENAEHADDQPTLLISCGVDDCYEGVMVLSPRVVQGMFAEAEPFNPTMDEFAVDVV